MEKITLLNKILNVSKNEWPRIVLAWTIHLLLRAGFVIGWTVTIAMFIIRIGIEYLPYVFVINALLIMGGTFLFSKLIRKIDRPILMLFTTLIAGTLLITSTLFVYSSNFLFFGIILLAQSVLLSQLNILISLFTEDLFLPLESQRAFPLIASAETIGGILGGLTVGLLSDTLASYKFIYIWILLTVLIIPILLTSHKHLRSIPSIEIRKKEKKKKRYSTTKNIRNSLKRIKKIPFLRGIVVVVMLQFMLLNLFEFQYTKAIKESIEEKQEHSELTINTSEYEITDNLKVSLIDSEVSIEEKENSKTILFENELQKSLGILQMIFSAGSLVIQIFIASRIIGSLGIVGSMIIHPIITFIHVLGMTINFNFLTAAIGRSGFEITGSIFKNAYHSSYYAISEKMRDQTKEILEGFVKPMGAILGFLALYFAQHISKGILETPLINLMMLIISLTIGIYLVSLQKKYTDLSNSHLNPQNELPTRLNAIEILSQKGHKIDSKILAKYLNRKGESKQIKLKILEALKRRQDIETIPEIMNAATHEDKEVKNAALETLLKFKNLKSQLTKKVFTRHRLIEMMKKLFTEENSLTIRGNCIEILAKIDDGDLIAFIINIMETGENNIKRACIKACKRFNDPNIIHYIENYLTHGDENIRAETIAALWQFKKIRKKLAHYRDQMKISEKKSVILATIDLLSEIGNKADLPYFIKKLGNKDPEIRHRAAIGLAKQNHSASIPHLVEFIIHENKTLAHKTKRFMKNYHNAIVENIEQLVHLKISNHINQIIDKSKAHSLFELDIETLEKLKFAYQIVDEHHEVFKIEKLIKEKTKTKSLTHKAHVSTS
jgi:HEAT repeat protein/MFS family permease